MALSPINVRRRPRQSRAKFTQHALLEATVQLLREKNFVDITIREITEIAGVGLGTFYEYFSQKEDVIALTIHHYIKENIQLTHIYAQHLLTEKPNISLKIYLEQIAQQQLNHIQNDQIIWATVFLLERQLSSVEIYQKHYKLMIQLWQNVLMMYPSEHPNHLSLATNLQRITYGFVMQTLLINPNFQDWIALKSDVKTAISAFTEH